METDPERSIIPLIIFTIPFPSFFRASKLMSNFCSLGFIRAYSTRRSCFYRFGIQKV